MFSADLQGWGIRVLLIWGRVAAEEVGVVSGERGLEARSSEHHKKFARLGVRQKVAINSQIEEMICYANI